MSVYLVILQEPDESVWNTLKKEWPNHHILDDRLACISTSPAEKNLLVEDICDRLGMGPENQVTGIVSQVSNAINGWYEQPFWEWLGKASK